MATKVEIVSGNFSAAGNFSGYDEDNERYFIPKRLMEAQGWNSVADVKFPFWTKSGYKEFNVLDDNGEPVVDETGRKQTFQRLQVLSIFESREAMIQSAIDRATIDIEIAAGIQAKASSAGLSATAVEALANAAF